VLTWLEDDGIAASKRHRALHDRDQHREVEWTDRRDNTDRKTDLCRVDAPGYTRTERAAVPASDRGQLTQHLDGAINLGPGIRERLA
jgi:hypothetical protein